MGIFIDKKSSDNVSNPSEFSIKTIFTKLEFLMRKIFHYFEITWIKRNGIINCNCYFVSSFWMNTKRIDMKKNIVKQLSNKFVSLYRYALNVTNASMKYITLTIIR